MDLLKFKFDNFSEVSLESWQSDDDIVLVNW